MKSNAGSYRWLFLKYCSFSIWDFLAVSAKEREGQKKLFLGNKIKNPSYRYKKIKTEKIELLLQNLDKLKNLIKKKEKNILIRNSYLEKIESKSNEANLVLSLARQKADLFQKYSRLVFGLPDAKTYDFCRSYFKKSFLSKRVVVPKKFNNIFKIARLRNTKNLDFIKSTKKISHRLKNQIDKFIQKIPQNKLFYEKDIKKYFQSALKSVGANSWKIKSDALGFRLDHKNKIVFIKKHCKVDGKRLRGLIAHEIGVHLLRRMGGEMLGEEILFIGLSGYEKIEEGFGLLKEMAAEGKELGADSIIVVLGIYFVVSRQKRKDFRSVFEFVRWMCGLVYENNGKIIINEKAWNICSRIFISPKWQSRGLLLSRDHIYLSGLLEILNTVGKSSNLIRYFNPKFGKINPFDIKHIRFIHEVFDQKSRDLTKTNPV